MYQWRHAAESGANSRHSPSNIQSKTRHPLSVRVLPQIIKCLWSFDETDESRTNIVSNIADTCLCESNNDQLSTVCSIFLSWRRTFKVEYLAMFSVVVESLGIVAFPQFPFLLAECDAPKFCWWGHLGVRTPCSLSTNLLCCSRA